MIVNVVYRPDFGKERVDDNLSKPDLSEYPENECSLENEKELRELHGKTLISRLDDRKVGCASSHRPSTGKIVSPDTLDEVAMPAVLSGDLLQGFVVNLKH